MTLVPYVPKRIFFYLNFMMTNNKEKIPTRKYPATAFHCSCKKTLQRKSYINRKAKRSLQQDDEMNEKKCKPYQNEEHKGSLDLNAKFGTNLRWSRQSTFAQTVM